MAGAVQFEAKVHADETSIIRCADIPFPSKDAIKALSREHGKVRQG